MKQMKKFIAACIVIAVAFLCGWYLYYGQGWYLIKKTNGTPAAFVRTQNSTIEVMQNGVFAPFEIKGVNMGSGVPGKFATEFGVEKSEYLRWFAQIQAMGANTIRVYTLLSQNFYDAFYEYNMQSQTPLYLIHGVWLNDYVQFSHRDAYDDAFFKDLKKSTRTVVDVIHGKRRLLFQNSTGLGIYRHDISQWVLGYILGVEWEETTVAFTDDMRAGIAAYQGEYLYSTPEATPFEIMLTQVGDDVMRYETERYGQQRLVAFANWPTTDPFVYPEAIVRQFLKIAAVDIEHIQLTNKVVSGTFASYHVYPYYPDYLNYTGENVADTEKEETKNTYYQYLKKLADYHTMPVIISEFGIPSSRGMAQRDENTARNQGGMSETQQAEALVECYRDIKAAGCEGGIVFTWQDEWFKRTWNSMYAVDLYKTPYWSDYQTNEQYFGLLSFDPGKEKSICYVNGQQDDWENVPVAVTNQNTSLSVQYDEKFLYFLVQKKGITPQDTIYIPIDTTQKSGASFCQNYNLRFDRNADFVIVLNGENSRVVVQERYATLPAIHSFVYTDKNVYAHPPAADSSRFLPIDLLLQTPTMLLDTQTGQAQIRAAEVYETGKLTQGNADPKAADYNSMADYCYGKDFVEIKIPWQLLNFSNPSEMKIHDDYYENYGVEYINLKTMYFSAAVNPALDETISLVPFSMKGWGQQVKYHERLKPAYYALQKLWS